MLRLFRILPLATAALLCGCGNSAPETSAAGNDSVPPSPAVVTPPENNPPAGNNPAPTDGPPPVAPGENNPPPPAAPPAPLAPVGMWLTGDLHVHDDHSSDGSAPRQSSNDQAPGNVSVADQIGQGELKLDWMPLTDHRTYDQHYDPLWQSSALLLLPGEEANGSPHSTVQSAVDTIVQGAGRAGAPDFINLQQSIWDAHSQGANWTIAHPDDGELEDDGVTPNTRANAQGMDLVETWNRASNGEKEIDYAENRWNAGWRFGVAGGSDDHFRELWPVSPPGEPITSVFAADLSERAIVQGLRAGRTAIRLLPTDPQVRLEADLQGDNIFEALGGDEVLAPAGTRGRLRVRVQNALGTTVLVYKSPGRAKAAFASFTPMGPDVSFTTDIVAENTPSWYRVEVRGVGQAATFDVNALKGVQNNPATLPSVLAQLMQETQNALRAMTSPIFISTAPVEAQPKVPLPADAGTDDGAQLTLGNVGQFAGFPDVAVANDIAHVAAETHGTGDTQIEYMHGTSTPVVITPASASARFPKIAARGNDVWIAWQDERAGQIPRRPGIYLRHSADGGITWQAEKAVRAIAGRSEHPALALTAAGRPVLAWQEISAGNPFDVMLQIGDAAPINLSREGKVVMPALLSDTRSARYPASVWPTLAVAPDGALTVAWQDNRTDADPLWTGATQLGEGTDPDNWQIMLRTLRGATWSAPKSLGADDLADRHPTIAYAADGTLAAAWDSKPLQSSGANLAVLSTGSKDGGATWSAPAAIAADTQAMSQYPRLGRDADGRIRAVWYDSRSADWRWRIYTAVLGTGGVWQGGKLIAARGINTWPATAGGVLVFSSTRNAQRLQRDQTQQVFGLKLP